jgi:hypothetical protein
MTTNIAALDIATATSTDLAHVPSNRRAETIAAMTDDELFAARRLIVTKLRGCEANREAFLTKSGTVKINLNDRQRLELLVADRNIEIYRQCLTLIDPAVHAANERRVERHLKEHAKDQVVKSMRDIANRLTRLAEGASNLADQLPGTEGGYLEAVLTVQREIAWAVPNMSLESMIRDAAKADR